MGGWNASHLEFNLSHQLSWGTYPRVGKNLTLELHGQPLAPWFLFFSLGQGFFPLGSLGTLKLNPFVPGGLLTAGSYPASGAASITGSIPNEPALIGQSLYWQDLGGFAPVFGNLEVTTFTGL